MSLVALAVTHLEAGPAEASRIAKVLPAGNSGTLAFLAAFHLATARFGLAGGTIAGYAAALAVLCFIERLDPIERFVRLRVDRATEAMSAGISLSRLATRGQWHLAVLASTPHQAAAPRDLVPRKPRHRGRFAPDVEALAW
jgi:hypothetical protein